jgi:hypothetical protein
MGKASVSEVYAGNCEEAIGLARSEEGDRGGGGTEAGVANRGYSPGTTDPRDIARQIMKNKYGYGDPDFDCFNNIIMRESDWIIDATNPSSGAYEIPQVLPAAKMASAGSDWRTNPANQIIWAIGYMEERYGSPCEPWTFKPANDWY